MNLIEQSGGSIHWLEPEPGIRLRTACWPEGIQGTVLILNGRTEYIEKYLETIAALQSRGLAVWTLDWRGQGLSTRLLPDPSLNHIESFETYLSDLDCLLDTSILPTIHQPLFLLAHSMGGHLGARLLARRPTLIARAILTAPMFAFCSAIPRPIARALIQLVNLSPGQSVRHGPGTPRLPLLDGPFATNPLTTCPDRYATLISQLRATPALQLGGATWGWLRAASASIAHLQRPGTISRIATPLLIATAGEEHFVDNRATARFAARLTNAEVLHIPEARHELLREQDRYRVELWTAIDEFLARTSHLPFKQEAEVGAGRQRTSQTEPANR